jgi:hypothetical protein
MFAKIVKFDCGCIGMPLARTGQAILIDACDRSPEEADREISFYVRNMENKSYVKLTVEEQKEYIDRIAALISDGYGLRTIKRIVTFERRQK